jgi:phosphopantothenoylcysteine decarboxylase/phosphopantothenate--cysteine ligase
MRDAVLAALPGQDVFIAAAAVADFMPAQAASQKIKKSAGTPELELVPTPDILAEVSRHANRPKLLVGFAAETEALEANALDKLKRKGLDLVAANQVGVPGTGFESDDNALSLYSAEGRQDIARASKSEVARQLLEVLAARLEPKQ